MKNGRRISQKSLKFFQSLIFILYTLPFSIAAQAQLPTCQPPAAGEYLILALTKTKEAQTQVSRSLPSEANKATVCEYLGEMVTRVGGFKNLEEAQKWGEYLRETVKISAVVARSPQTSDSASSSPSSQPRYNPKPLGKGYAVLIDYFNQPETATAAKKSLGKDVGLAVYLARPYLLAVYTTNEREANDALERLSASGFWTILVDSNLVTLLTPTVRYDY
jgi:hypothetical protein